MRRQMRGLLGEVAASTPPLCPGSPRTIPAPAVPVGVAPLGPEVAALRERDPVVCRYRAFFALLDWGAVPERDARRPWPGSPPHPTAAYGKALLVKLCEGKPFVTDLRRFLVE